MATKTGNDRVETVSINGLTVKNYYQTIRDREKLIKQERFDNSGKLQGYTDYKISHGKTINKFIYTLNENGTFDRVNKEAQRKIAQRQAQRKPEEYLTEKEVRAIAGKKPQVPSAPTPRTITTATGQVLRLAVQQPTPKQQQYKFEFLPTGGIKGPIKELTPEQRTELGNQYKEYQKDINNQKVQQAKGLAMLGRATTILDAKKIYGISTTTASSSKSPFDAFGNASKEVGGKVRVQKVVDLYTPQSKGFSLTEHSGNLGILEKEFKIVTDYVGGKMDKASAIMDNASKEKVKKRLGLTEEQYQEEKKKRSVSREIFGYDIAPFQDKIRNAKSSTKLDLATWFIPGVQTLRWVSYSSAYVGTVSDKQGRAMMKEYPLQTALSSAVVITPIAIKGYGAIKYARSPQAKVDKFFKQVKGGGKIKGVNTVDKTTRKYFEQGVLKDTLMKGKNLQVQYYKIFSNKGKLIGTESRVIGSKGETIKSVINTDKYLFNMRTNANTITTSVFGKKGLNLKQIGESFSSKISLQSTTPFNVKQEKLLSSETQTQLDPRNVILKQNQYLLEVGNRVPKDYISESYRAVKQSDLITQATVTDSVVKTRVFQTVNGKQIPIASNTQYGEKALKFTDKTVAYAKPKTFMRATDFKSAFTIDKPATVRLDVKQFDTSTVSYLYKDLTPIRSLNPVTWGKRAQVLLNPTTITKNVQQVTRPQFAEFTVNQNLRPGAVNLLDSKIIKPQTSAVFFPALTLSGEKGTQTINFNLGNKGFQDRIFKSKLVMIEKPKTEQTIFTKTKTDTKLNFDSLIKTRSATITKQVNFSIAEEIQVQKPKIEKESILKSITKTVQKPKTKDFFSTAFNIRETQTPIIPIGGIKRPNSDNNKMFTGFDVFVRKKGKFVKENTLPLSRGQALNFGAFTVGNNASATFKIEESKDKKKKLGSFFGKGNLLDFNIKGGLYIEKKSRRIKSQGELSQITYKGLTTKKMGRRFFV